MDQAGSQAAPLLWVSMSPAGCMGCTFSCSSSQTTVWTWGWLLPGWEKLQKPLGWEQTFIKRQEQNPDDISLSKERVKNFTLCVLQLCQSKIWVRAWLVILTMPSQLWLSTWVYKKVLMQGFKVGKIYMVLPLQFFWNVTQRARLIRNVFPLAEGRVSPSGTSSIQLFEGNYSAITNRHWMFCSEKDKNMWSWICLATERLLTQPFPKH